MSPVAGHSLFFFCFSSFRFPFMLGCFMGPLLANECAPSQEHCRFSVLCVAALRGALCPRSLHVLSGGAAAYFCFLAPLACFGLPSLPPFCIVLDLACCCFFCSLDGCLYWAQILGWQWGLAVGGPDSWTNASGICFCGHCFAPFGGQIGFHCSQPDICNCGPLKKKQIASDRQVGASTE